MKTWLLTIIGALVLTVVAGIILAPVSLIDYRASGYTANVGEVVSGVVVGQTFVATKDKLSEVAVMFATYSGRDNTHPIKFTLRNLEKPLETIRQVEAQADQFGDNQLHRFNFDSIPNSEGKTYILLIESQSSVAGNALTVDIDNRDPYHFGAAYIIKGVTTDTLSEAQLSASGKAGLDLSFSTYYQVPLWRAAIAKGVETVTYLKDSWQDKRSLYEVWAQVGMQALVLLGITWLVSLSIPLKDRGTRNTKKRVVGWLILLTILGIVARLIYAVELPVTNDEGNYLYDARTLLNGGLAGGDGYVKAPLVIIWIAFWQLIGGTTLLMGRLSSIVIAALTAWPIYIIARELWGRKAGLCAATVWSLLGVTTVFGIYVHTQPLSIFWGVSGIAVLLIGIRKLEEARGSLQNKAIQRSLWWMYGAGLLLGVGVVSRKSILALGLVVLLSIIVGVKNWRYKIKSLIAVGVGFALILSMFLLVSWMVYGPEGFWEATGFNSAADGLGAVEESEKDQVRAYSLRGMTPFFRESLPLILLSMLGLGFVGEQALGVFFASLSWFKRNKLLVLIAQKASWIIPLAIYSWAWSFFREYEGSSIMVYGMWQLWWAMIGVIVIFALWPGRKPDNSVQIEEKQSNGGIEENPDQSTVKPLVEKISSPNKWVGWLVPIVWLGGSVFFYMNWIKFHANYIGEFLPPLVIVSGVAIPEIWRRVTVFGGKGNAFAGKALKLMVMILFTVVLYWALFVSGYVTYMYEHSGTFKQSALQEAAAWAKENIPTKESIFTGAAAVPYLSGHHTALDIAHPRWYAYEFTRKDTVRLNTFLPPIEEMLAAYREANWFLHEKQTGFSFMMEYSEIEAGLNLDWEQMHGIENGSNTLTFYKRINTR
jgi:4-amino-4-deoxy-L-arabinose transferase-like glycosyltransferase